MHKRYGLITVVIVAVVVAILTFGTTYSVMYVNNAVDDAELANRYNERLESIELEYDENLATIEGMYAEKFSSLEEMYGWLPTDQKSAELIKKLTYIDSYYRALYIGDIDEEDLAYYVMKGYIQGVGDKYAVYYTADDFKIAMQETQGEVYGIGVTVCYNSEYDAIEVLSVNPDSPALNAGVLPGDIIIKVGDTPVSEIGYYETIDLIKGEEGTTTSFTVLRGTEQIPFTVERAKVEFISVIAHKYEFDQKIGVVRIVEFNDAVPEQFKEAVNALLDDGVEKIVFDLRYNPGGTLDSVVEMLDFLLPEGDIVHIMNANGEEVRKYTSDAACVDVPMAVLVNSNTASAAELFTCALRDYEKAVIVGEKTYGKGTMQTVYMLPDMAGLSLSTHMYNPPKSENYEGIGITPDVEVALDPALENKNIYKFTDAEDNQLETACSELGYTK